MTNQKPAQGGLTGEQIEAAAISFSCATEEDWWDQEETFREVTRIEVRRAFEAAARIAQSASASAHPADDRHACSSHRPVQHRDAKEPWCKACGLTVDGREPNSRLRGEGR